MLQNIVGACLHGESIRHRDKFVEIQVKSMGWISLNVTGYTGICVNDDRTILIAAKYIFIHNKKKFNTNMLGMILWRLFQSIMSE